MRKRIVIIGTFLIMLLALCACDKKVDSDNSEQNYISNAVAPEIQELIFENLNENCEVRYSEETDLIAVDGVQEFVIYEEFCIYERDENGNFIRCKSIMITKPDANQQHMEECIKSVYGENFEYLKPYDNVYVIEQEIPLPSK